MTVRELSEICKLTEYCAVCECALECDKFAELRFKYLPCKVVPEDIDPIHPIMEVEL